MINIFRVEVSNNGRSHLLLVDNKASIDVNNKTELEHKKKELKDYYENELKMKDLVIYLSYTEK